MRASRAVIVAVLVASGCGRVGFDPQGDRDVTVDATAGGDSTGSAGQTHSVALVSSAGAWSSSTVTSQQVALASPPAAGNVLVVSVSTSFQVPTSVTDNAGNTYMLTPSSPTMNSSTYCNIFVYYARNIVTTPGFVVTVNAPSDHLTLALFELAGADPASPLAADLLQSGTSTTPSCGPIPSQVSGSLYLASLCHNGTTTTTMGSGFQLLQAPTESGNTNSALATAYKVGDATPTTVSATLSSSDGWQLLLAAFQ